MRTKILLFILLSLFTAKIFSQSDDIYTNSNNQYDEYDDYVGVNARLKELEENDMVRGNSLILLMMHASMSGLSADSITDLVTKYNTLYGTSYTVPVYTYGLTMEELYNDTIIAIILESTEVIDTMQKYAIDTVEAHTFVNFGTDSLTVNYILINDIAFYDSVAKIVIDTTELYDYNSLTGDTGDFDVLIINDVAFVDTTEKIAIDTTEWHQYNSLHGDTVFLDSTARYIYGADGDYIYIKNGTYGLYSFSMNGLLSQLTLDVLDLTLQTSAPATANDGKMYYNNSDEKLYCHIDGSWTDIGGSGAGTPSGNTHAVQVNRDGSFSGVGDSLTFNVYLFVASDTAATRDWTLTNFIQNGGTGADGRLSVWDNAYDVRGESELRWDDTNKELEIDGSAVFDADSGAYIVSNSTAASNIPSMRFYIPNYTSNTDTLIEVKHNTKVLMQMFDDSTKHIGDFHNYGNLSVDGDMDVTGESSFYDTIRYNAVTPPTRYGWLYVDSLTYSINADSLVDAGTGLTDRLMPIDNYLGDTKNGEVRWVYNNKGEAVYGFEGEPLKPSEVIFALQWQNEHLLRYINDLDIRMGIMEAKFKGTWNRKNKRLFRSRKK